MTLSEIKSTCDKIKSISSTNEKKEFLASITDEDFKNFLKWEFDSSIVSGLSDKKINKVLSDDMFDDLVMAYENGNDDFRKGMNEVLMIITYKNVPELVEHMKKIVEEEEEN